MAAHSSDEKTFFRCTFAIGSDPVLTTFFTAIQKWIKASPPPGAATPNCRARTNFVWRAVHWGCTRHADRGAGPDFFRKHTKRLSRIHRA
eukprot:11062318-Alexandrium_andersonii.AAC.1